MTSTSLFWQIVSVFETLSSTQAQAFYYGLLPPVDDGGELIAQLEALLGTITGSKHDNLIRFVRESIDDSNRIVKCRRLVAGL